MIKHEKKSSLASDKFSEKTSLQPTAEINLNIHYSSYYIILTRSQSSRERLKIFIFEMRIFDRRISRDNYEHSGAINPQLRVSLIQISPDTSPKMWKAMDDRVKESDIKELHLNIKNIYIHKERMKD